MSGERKTGARLLVEALAAQGVERVFLAPRAGSSPLRDALAGSPIAAVATAREASAAFMAEATAKLTGRPGVCVVAGASGAAAAFAGLHLAAHDGTPMLVLVVGSERCEAPRGAVDGSDLRAVFGSVAKQVAEIDRPDRVADGIARAVALSTCGRPGPVVLGLSADLLAGEAEAVAVPPVTPIETHPGLHQLWDLQKRLWAAERPIAVLGGSRWSEKAVRQFTRFAEKFELPVACAIGRHMLFDHANPLFAGELGIDLDPALEGRLRAADLILLVGARPAEMPGRARAFLDRPPPAQTLVHVHPDAEELGRVRRADLAVHATATAFAAAAESLEPPPGEIRWRDWSAAAHADRLAWSAAPPATTGEKRLEAVVAALRARLGDDTVVVGGTGDAPARVQRLWRFRRFGGQVAPIAAVVGYALPAAIAAALQLPDRRVVGFADADCFRATSPDLATAVRAGARVVVFVFDDASDVAAPARAHGALGLTVAGSDEIVPAIEAALAHDGVAVVHLKA